MNVVRLKIYERNMISMNDTAEEEGEPKSDKSVRSRRDGRRTYEDSSHRKGLTLTSCNTQKTQKTQSWHIGQKEAGLSVVCSRKNYIPINDQVVKPEQQRNRRRWEENQTTVFLRSSNIKTQAGFFKHTAKWTLQSETPIKKANVIVRQLIFRRA